MDLLNLTTTRKKIMIIKKRVIGSDSGLANYPNTWASKLRFTELSDLQYCSQLIGSLSKQEKQNHDQLGRIEKQLRVALTNLRWIRIQTTYTDCYETDPRCFAEIFQDSKRVTKFRIQSVVRRCKYTRRLPLLKRQLHW